MIILSTFVVNNHVVLVGTSPTTGTVNIVQGTQWYSVCDHSWTLQDARVVCRSMGYWLVSDVTYSLYLNTSDGFKRGGGSHPAPPP